MCEEISEKGREEENWREKDNTVEQWKQITKVAVQRSDKLPSSLLYKRENERKNKLP